MMTKQIKIFFAVFWGILIIPSVGFAYIATGLAPSTPWPTWLMLGWFSMLAIPISLIISCVGEIFSATGTPSPTKEKIALVSAVLPIAALLIFLAFFNS